MQQTQQLETTSNSKPKEKIGLILHTFQHFAPSDYITGERIGERLTSKCTFNQVQFTSPPSTRLGVFQILTLPQQPLTKSSQPSQ